MGSTQPAAAALRFVLALVALISAASGAPEDLHNEGNGGGADGEPSLLYSLQVEGLSGSGAGAVEVRAGNDPVRVAAVFCNRWGIGDHGCAEITRHLCAETELLCRSLDSLAPHGKSPSAGPSSRSLVAADTAVARTLVSWTTTSLELAGPGSPVSCALELLVYEGDVEKDQALATPMSYIESLISLHCTNLARYRPACVCSANVREGLLRALAGEIDKYRWSTESSHYVRLAINPRADASEIRRAYRRVSMLVHPDRHPAGEAREMAQKKTMFVNEAYEVLTDAESRRSYDVERFGSQFVINTQLPQFQAEVMSVFGRFAGVSVDHHGNLKIVL